MTRIKSTNVQMGSNYILPIERETNVKDSEIEEALAQKEKILLQAQTEAKELLEKTRGEAEQIIVNARDKANEQVESIKYNAHKEGFDAGHQEGLDKAVEDMVQKVLAVDALAQGEFDIKRSIVKSADKDIVELVIEIARKVCDNAIKIDKEIIAKITETAIKSLKDKESITIIVNPETAEKIYAITDELKERISQLKNIKIIEDRSVSPDGSIVESPLSRVDSRVCSQINNIADKLMMGLQAEDGNDVQ